MAGMPPLIYFLILPSVSLAAVVGLRLRCSAPAVTFRSTSGSRIRRLTDIAVTLPLISFMIVFVAGLVWLWW